MLLWQLYVAGNNKTYLGLHIEGPIFPSDFNQIRSFSTDFHKILQNQISLKSVQRELLPYTQKDAHMDGRETNSAFHGYVKTAKNWNSEFTAIKFLKTLLG
jgi:hypothetical protein